MKWGRGQWSQERVRGVGKKGSRYKPFQRLTPPQMTRVFRESLSIRLPELLIVHRRALLQRNPLRPPRVMVSLRFERRDYDYPR